MVSISNSILLVIDVQGNLVGQMYSSKELLDRVGLCIKAAKILGIPIITTEQVPQKLGKTVPAIAELLGELEPIEKNTFSCWGNPDFVNRLRACQKSEVILVGIEAHVCVFQTAADLLSNKFKVQVVTDAVSSRAEANKLIALTRMKDLGAVLTTTEMLVTELIRGADHPNFREILSLIK